MRPLVTRETPATEDYVANTTPSRRSCPVGASSDARIWGTTSCIARDRAPLASPVVTTSRGDRADTAQRRPSGVVVSPSEFNICDHMEVVYDLDTEARVPRTWGSPTRHVLTVDRPWLRVFPWSRRARRRAAQTQAKTRAHVTVTGTGPFHRLPERLLPARPGHPPRPQPEGCSSRRGIHPHTSAPARAAVSQPKSGGLPMSTIPHVVVPPGQEPSWPRIRGSARPSLSTPRATRPATRGTEGDAPLLRRARRVHH